MTPSAEQITTLIELWNDAVASAGRGCPADPKAVRIRKIAASLYRVSPGRETFSRRARMILAERWRHPEYTTLRSLYASWDSLAEKEKLLDQNRQPTGAGQPPTPLSLIRAIWASPRTPPEAFGPIRSWLSQH